MSLHSHGIAANPPPPIFDSNYRPPIHIQPMDNGFVLSHGSTQRICTNLFQAAKYIRQQAVEQKRQSENNKTI